MMWTRARVFLFGVSLILDPILGGQIPPNLYSAGVNRRFQAKRAEFLADRTIGRAIGTACRLSSVCLSSVCL